MKTALVLSMLLATSAFGAATFSVTPAEVVAAPGSTFALDIMVKPDGTNSINGFNLYTTSVTPAGSLIMKTRTFGTVLSDALYTQTVAEKALGSVANLGAVSPDPSIGSSGSAAFKLMTLELALANGVTPSTQNPVVIVFNGTWSDTEFGEGAAGNATVTITPEPASMMLLAAGAAFFARRRRA